VPDGLTWDRAPERLRHPMLVAGFEGDLGDPGAHRSGANDRDQRALSLHAVKSA
jgi:hypothetical protein